MRTGKHFVEVDIYYSVWRVVRERTLFDVYSHRLLSKIKREINAPRRELFEDLIDSQYKYIGNKYDKFRR